MNMQMIQRDRPSVLIAGWQSQGRKHRVELRRLDDGFRIECFTSGQSNSVSFHHYTPFLETDDQAWAWAQTYIDRTHDVKMFPIHPEKVYGKA